MTKKSGIAVIIGTWLLFNTNTAQAQLPTVDFGNLAGTIGIVTQGITSVQQGIQVITNASKAIAIIGDAVGTISKFASTIKGYVQDVQQTIERAKQRIEEGRNLYNKYKDEIEARKAKYQELLESIPNYTNPNSYDDSSDSSSSSGRNNTSYPGSSYNNTGNSSAQNPSNHNNNGGSVRPTTGGNSNPVNINNNNNTYTGRQNTSSTNNSAARENTSGYSRENSGFTGVNNGIGTQEKEPPLFGEEEEQQEEDVEDTAKQEIESTPAQKENVAVPGVGRRAFGAPETTDKKVTNEETIEKETTEETGEDAKKTEENTSKDVEQSKQETPSVSTPETKFRVSPSSDSGKRSQNTVIYSSRFAFAAETNNSTVGTGYDKNNVFIFNTKYCDKSVDDMMSEEGTRSCLVKIVNNINKKNAYDAANNMEDCKKMVFETAVALLAEATKIKYEASNYQDTLDEQESLGGDSNNTRDDTQVLAMNYEQTQILLNKLITILSGETIFNITKEICGVSEKVLEPEEVNVEADNGGK